MVVDKPAFAGEVRQWLSVELTDQDIVDIYGGGKNPGFPPSCVVYHAMKYINGNPQRIVEDFGWQELRERLGRIMRIIRVMSKGMSRTLI